MNSDRRRATRGIRPARRNRCPSLPRRRLLVLTSRSTASVDPLSGSPRRAWIHTFGSARGIPNAERQAATWPTSYIISSSVWSAEQSPRLELPMPSGAGDDPASMRGYKIVNGKKTSYFHTELTDEAKALLEKNAGPKKISKEEAAKTLKDTAARHTYDNYQAKWDKWDNEEFFERAMAQADADVRIQTCDVIVLVCTNQRFPSNLTIHLAVVPYRTVAQRSPRQQSKLLAIVVAPLLTRYKLHASACCLHVSWVSWRGFVPLRVRQGGLCSWRSQWLQLLPIDHNARKSDGVAKWVVAHSFIGIIFPMHRAHVSTPRYEATDLTQSDSITCKVLRHIWLHLPG